MALGALYIQQRLGVTDRETVELITESPYLQFFIGLSGFQYLKPFEKANSDRRQNRHKQEKIWTRSHSDETCCNFQICNRDGILCDEF